MIWYWMSPAGIFQGLPADYDLSKKWILKATHDDKKVEAFLKRYPGRLTSRFRHAPEDFGRLILKIGYCQALTMLDLEDFTSICVPRIMGSEGNVSYLVGSKEEADERIQFGYHLSTEAVGTLDEMTIFSNVRLYPNLHSPTYHAVIGKVTGRTRVQHVYDKWQKAYGVQVEAVV